MHRYILLWVIMATVVAPPLARAQATGSGGSAVRVRASTPAGDSAARARRERLLLRFDSLRWAFEQKRLSDADRDRLAEEMDRTVMALQESLGGGEDRVRARSGGTRIRLSTEEIGATPELAMALGRFTPRGYLGVSFDGPSVEEIRAGGERIIRFLDYPKIALVEPSSPAERAGIQEGDTLLALNGMDVRERQISLTRLLVPEQHVVVRLRREGNPKEFKVKIGEAPGYVVSRRTPVPPMPPVSVRVYPGEDFPQPAPLPAIARDMPQPPEPMRGSVWIINEGIAGAKLETISEGLGKALGAKAGVLVLRAAPGTPAFESGLRDGDVILGADGKEVASVRQLRMAIVDADGDQGVRLSILRERKKREVTLRW
jgi:hypothetical protein